MDASDTPGRVPVAATGVAGITFKLGVSGEFPVGGAPVAFLLIWI